MESRDSDENLQSSIDCIESKRYIYEKSKLYWQNISRDIEGMLGGFTILHESDITDSKKFISSLQKLKMLPSRSTAIDCGCGIGRITKELLLPLFNSVDMVDITEGFIEESTVFVGESNNRIGRKYVSALQSFQFLPNFYDLIWVQWVTGYLTNRDFIKFMKNCKRGLKLGGCIVIKDNVSSTDCCDYDTMDSSWTRPKDLIVNLCKESGLKMVHDKKQRNFPDDVLPVFMMSFR